MINLYLKHPEWQWAINNITGLAEKSAWTIHCPKNYGKLHFFNYLKGIDLPNHKVTAVDLDRPKANNKAVSPELNWIREFVAHPDNSDGRIQDFVKIVRESEYTILIVLRGVSNVLTMVSLLEAFWRVKLDMEDDKHLFKVVALDDYSLYYYERWIAVKYGKSLFDFYSSIEVGVLDLRHIHSILVSSELNAEVCAKPILEATGGHLGLVVESIRALQESKIVCEDIASVRKYLSRTSMVEHIRQTLILQVRGNIESALKYRNKQVSNHNLSACDQHLHKMGVLFREGIVSTLCSGIISDVVSQLVVEEKNSNDEAVYTYVGAQLETPVDPQPCDDGFVLVHVSDIHLKKKEFPFVVEKNNSNTPELMRDICDLMRVDVRNAGLSGKIDVAIASGDFTTLADPNEFRDSEKFVRYMLKSIGISESTLVVTAGNHDISWSEDDVARGRSRSNYEDFKKRYLNMGDDCACELLDFPSRSGKSLLRVLVMDSNLVESKAASGIGFVPPKAFEDALEKLNNSNRTKEFDRLYKVLVVHHHVLPVTSLDARNAANKDVSLIANASELIEFAAAQDFRVILHGHQHKPCITDVSRWISGKPNGQVSQVLCVGAGSFSADVGQLAPYGKNHYYIIQLKGDQILIRSRVLEAETYAFRPDGNMVIRW